MSPVLGLSTPEISLIFFMSMFVVLVLRLVFSRAERWQKDARIPLSETPVEDSGTGGTDHVR